MSKCQSCKSERIISIYGKCDDHCSVNIGENNHEGYVPCDLGVGGGDDIELDYCADCGQLQGDFPLQPTKLEENTNFNDEIDE
jgi:hypothetical protein